MALVKVIAICLAAIFLARYLVGGGLVRSGLDTSFGDAVYTCLREFFNVNGSEDSETLVVFVVLGASLVFVAALAWLLGKLVTKYSSTKNNR
ncbi:hypothetical protein [Pseudomonas syringae]|uniref:hypothetical protein n=1 Tax=Pseudomonas syringae TaxID=317 RepID=UPI0013723E8A|nr:hypothetical protein [Pseudomonas syringae]NAS98625.1 hypothetical protein [Pseudomonas syringae pv. actinidifoliorum]NAT24898.1 hypothetical protein [Pseudomonas syringae pv. actinidifoliorum]NAT37490.1 hypothetical protein [Pseudomonas syringae pv. actinidifoliorum]NAT64247.1 hypothetical protein [Pseudomonas syringae pv. actinidifoliorum]